MTEEHTKLLKKLKKEIKKEDGYFILNFGKKRKFPTVFADISPTNYSLLHTLYADLYETSLNAYLKKYFYNIDRSILQIVEYYESVIEFMFGNDEHRGVYPEALKMYIKQFGEEVDIEEFLPSVEHLFVSGYRIKNINNDYFFVNPNLQIEFELEKINSENQVVSYDYLPALMELLKISTTEKLSDIKKIASLSFELSADGERKVFNIPTNKSSATITLNEVLQLDDFVLQNAKLTENHASCLLSGKYYNAVNTSFVGQKVRNYFWLLSDYAEYNILHDLYETYGFRFINNITTKYVIDHDGYLVSKLVLTAKGMASDELNYYPTAMRHAFTFIDQMSYENRNSFLQELSTYTLLQFCLGNNEIDETTFQVDLDTRKITNFHHSGRSLQNKYAYESVPNNMVKLNIDLSMDLMLEYSQLLNIFATIRKNNVIDSSNDTFFGFDKKFAIGYTKDIIKHSDRLNVYDIPANVFAMEFGVMSDIGIELYNGKQGIYDNWFAQQIKTSGIPEYSEQYLILCNRFALFSLLSADAKGKL